MEMVRVACERTDGLRWEPRRLFPTADEIIWDPNLPADSPARALRFRFGHVLMRPYSPQGFRDIACLDGETRKLYVEKDDRWPKIWGWPLAIAKPDAQEYPAIVPGSCMFVYKRFGDELLAEEKPKVELYLGHILLVKLSHLQNIEVVFTPSPVPQEY